MRRKRITNNMKTILSWVIANIGTFIRIITTIILLLMFLAIPSKTDDAIIGYAFLLGIYYCFGSGISKLLAEYPLMGVLLSLAAGVGYFLFFGQEGAVDSTLILCVVPILSAIVAIIVAIYAVKNMDEMLDFAFFINNSAVEHFATASGYFLNRFAETLINLLLSSTAITILALLEF